MNDFNNILIICLGLMGGSLLKALQILLILVGVNMTSILLIQVNFHILSLFAY